MNIISILTGIAMIGASALALEGINKATDGNFYLSSVKYLAEASPSPSDSGSMPPTMAPPPSSSSGSSQPPMMPPPPTSGSSDSSNGQPMMMPPPPSGGFGSGDMMGGSNFNGGQPGSSGQMQMMPPPNGGTMMPNDMNGNQNQPPMEKMQGGSQQNSPQTGKSFFDFFGGDQKSSGNNQQQMTQQMMGNQQRGQSGQFGQQQMMGQQQRGGQTMFGQQGPRNGGDGNKNNGDQSSFQMQNQQQFQDEEETRPMVNPKQLQRELKQIQQSLKRADKILTTKAVQSLGLNTDAAKQALSTMRQSYDQAQSLYSAGSYDDAQEALQDIHMDAHPGDIESTIMRIRDIKSMIKRVKDTEVRGSVDKVLQEVVDKFNNGEYRDARETLDEYSDDIMGLLSQFIKARRINRQQSNSQIQNLGDLIGKKLEEIDSKQGQNQESSAGSNNQ